MAESLNDWCIRNFDEVRKMIFAQDDPIREQGAQLGEMAGGLTDAVRRLDGIATELSKTNERFDAIVADREKHQKRLDDRLEEIMEATQEAERAFEVRIAKAEKLALAYAQRNANLVRDMKNQGGTD